MKIGYCHDGSSTKQSSAVLVQPQGKQKGSVDSQCESRNQPVAGTVRTPAPTRMRIAVHGCTVKGTGESLLPSVLSRVGTRGYIVKRRYFTLDTVGINNQDARVGQRVIVAHRTQPVANATCPFVLVNA